MQLQEVLNLAKQLSPVDKVRLIQELAPDTDGLLKLTVLLKIGRNKFLAVGAKKPGFFCEYQELSVGCEKETRFLTYRAIHLRMMRYNRGKSQPENQNKNNHSK